MLVLRGRFPVVADDRAAMAGLADRVAAAGEPGLRVWRPPRHVTFGPRDVSHAGYQAARREARNQDCPPIERETGGRAVVHTGGTISFLRVDPVQDYRSGLTKRYERVRTAIDRALHGLGVEPRPGEPPNAFCPGSHSLQADGKLVGLAQRVGRSVATVGGVLVVTDPEQIVEVLTPVYAALDLPLDPETVGSIASAGGEGHVPTARRAVEDALVADADQPPTILEAEQVIAGEPDTEAVRET